MCGIAGIRRLDGSPVDEPLLAAMIGSMAHRGPDATGIWTSRNVGLAHCRLSIIDPGGSAQPWPQSIGDLTWCSTGRS